MKKLIICTTLCLWVFSQSYLVAQINNTELTQALDTTLDSMFQELGVNGISAAIHFSNNSTWTGVNGVSTYDPIDSISSNHLFETGSTTKTITSACILALHDEGVLSLEDSIHNWLPTLPHIDSTITIKQLLRHQSGISDLLLNPVFQPTLLQDPNRIWTAEEAIETFIQAPIFSSGTSWSYSNTNYILLGMIIEKATGHTFDEELKQRFFTPLSLSSFRNPAIDSIIEPYAHLWLDTNGDGSLDDAGPLISTWYSIFSIIGPPGGYFATSKDLAQWIHTSMQGTLLKDSTWQEAIETVSTNLPNGIKYGLGMMESTYLGHRALGHGGDLSYSTQAQYFPALDISIVVNTNDARITSWNLIPTVRELLNTYLIHSSSNNIDLHTEDLESTINIFPNPISSNEELTILSRIHIPIAQINLLNNTGELIWTNQETIHEGNNRLDIPALSDLAKGSYFITIIQDKKLIKKDTIIKS